MIRDNIMPGEQTAADLFRVVSLGKGNNEIPGFPLARVFVNGKELKGILEILYIASESGGGSHCYYGGMKVEYDPDGGFLKKVKTVEVLDEEGEYRSIDFSKKNPALYSIAANSYMLEFVSYFKKLSHGLVRIHPKHRDGSFVTDFDHTWIDADTKTPETEEIKVWLSLIEYLRTFDDIDGNGIPDIPDDYSFN